LEKTPYKWNWRSEIFLILRCVKSRSSQNTCDKKAIDQEKQKKRVVVLLCCNAIGTEKTMPLVIRKYQNPRCFNNISTQTLPVRYTESLHFEGEKNEWMKKYMVQYFGTPSKADYTDFLFFVSYYYLNRSEIFIWQHR